MLGLMAGCAGTKEVAKAPVVETATIAELPEYRSAYTRYFDLIHTALELTPVWQKKEMEGTAVITAHPHFYPTDSLVLHARGMIIHEVDLKENDNSKQLLYDYKNDDLTIYLPRKMQRTDTVTVSIRYTARPETLPPGGSRAIIKDKGLYFINADSSDHSTPTQLWSQGETESNSAWFPTIESPEQKMTSEITLHVDTAFETVSNGILVSSVVNGDGTRTDHWKQDLPMAPYLVMIAVGNFAKVTDQWNGMEVSYYVDPHFEKMTRNVFGHTPEMIDYFSKLLNYPYPWAKYSQIVVHDYVSGAMENTSAVIHGTNMQLTTRELLDRNYEYYISHELFHHWFGDLVTCRSWSNITLNEGFANYAEYLWNEHKYGKQYADENLLDELSGYLNASEKADPPLIRYYYNDREDMYDRISYNKGGCVLHMLRKYVGDEAFFSALHLYLTRHAFGTAEVDDLRQAFEDICGEDLHWFFNQWFLSNGYPILQMDYNWKSDNHSQQITLTQLQDLKKNPLFRLPLDVDFYFGEKKITKKIVMTKQKQDFTFVFETKPDMIIVDPERSMVGKRKDNKSFDDYVYQYYHTSSYMLRLSPVLAINSNFISGTPAEKMMIDALKDSSGEIRSYALSYLKSDIEAQPDSFYNHLVEIALHDTSTDNRTMAYDYLGNNFPFEKVRPLFLNALSDSSYHVIAKAFKITAKKGNENIDSITTKLEELNTASIYVTLTDYYSENTKAGIDKSDYFLRALDNTNSWSKYYVIENYNDYIQRSNDVSIISRSIDKLRMIGSTSNNRSISRSCIKALNSGKNILDAKLKEIEEKEKDSSTEHLSPTDQRNKIDYQKMKEKIEAAVAGIKNK